MASPLTTNQTMYDALVELGLLSSLSPWGIMAWGTTPRSSRLQPGEMSQNLIALVGIYRFETL